MHTLYRLPYSPYARKVQRLLELAGEPHRLVDVPYGDREELARLTGGYVYVPVLQTAGGEVLVESRAICAWILRGGSPLVPPALEAGVWAYHDFVEALVEDVLFRLASPGVRDAWPTAWERALYVLVKERKFGAGCVDAWQADRAGLLARGRALLEPTRRTLERQPYVFGTLTLADVALYGQWAMLEAADTTLLPALGEAFVAHARRVEGATLVPG